MVQVSYSLERVTAITTAGDLGLRNALTSFYGQLRHRRHSGSCSEKTTAPLPRFGQSCHRGCCRSKRHWTGRSVYGSDAGGGAVAAGYPWPGPSRKGVARDGRHVARRTLGEKLTTGAPPHRAIQLAREAVGQGEAAKERLEKAIEKRSTVTRPKPMRKSASLRVGPPSRQGMQVSSRRAMATLIDNQLAAAR